MSSQGSFKNPPATFDLPGIERGILEFWRSNAIPGQSLQSGAQASRSVSDAEGAAQVHDGQRPFVFFDGPPFATGLPHYGHLLAGTIKDIVPRYFAMNGRPVERRFGWDCHGLPIESLIEKELNVHGRAAIEELGVPAFNQACREGVLRFTQQ